MNALRAGSRVLGGERVLLLGSGEDDALVTQFLANLSAFTDGRTLTDRVI